MCNDRDARMTVLAFLSAKLWRLLVVASVDPRLGPEKRTNEGKLVDVQARQLGGLDC